MFCSISPYMLLRVGSRFDGDNYSSVTQCVRSKQVSNAHCLFQPGHFCLGFAPVVDGLDGFLPDVPLEMRKRGEFPDIPVMTGYLQEDGA